MTEGGNEMPLAAFVLNPVRARGAARVVAGCVAAATAAGWDSLALETSAGDPGTSLARRAVAAGQ